MNKLLSLALLAIVAATGVRADGLTPAGSSSQGLCYASGSSGPRVPCIQQGTTWTPLLRPTDEGSGLCVKAPGSALCRTLADRAADTISAADRAGVDRSGATDTATALDQVLQSAGAAGKTAKILSGLYRLDRFIVPPTNSTVSVEGAKFSGPGGILSADWAPYLVGEITGTIRRSDKPGTEFGTIHSFEMLPTGSAQGYQKGAGYFVAKQQDPSDYVMDGKPSLIIRDLTGITTSCEIANGNMRGRCWGGASYAIGKPGSRGTLIGWESDIFKYDGIDQPLSDNIDTSIGVLSVAFGGRATTAFAASSAEGGNWYHGFTTRQGEVLNTAFGVQKAGEADVWNWRVTPDGRMTTQDISATAVTTSGAVTATGGVVATGITVTGGNAITFSPGASGAAATISASNGPLYLAPSGTSPIYFGSISQATIAQGDFIAGGNAIITGKVGFNGAAPAGRCSLPAALPTDGSASNAAIASAINAARSCLITFGIAQ